MLILIIISAVVLLSVYGGTPSGSEAASVIDLPAAYVPPREIIEQYTADPPERAETFAEVLRTEVNPAPYVPESVYQSEPYYEDAPFNPRESLRIYN